MNLEGLQEPLSEIQFALSGVFFNGFMLHSLLMGGLWLLKVENPHVRGIDKAAIDVIKLTGLIYGGIFIIDLIISFLSVSWVDFVFNQIRGGRIFQPILWVIAAQLLRVHLFAQTAWRAAPVLVLWFSLQGIIVFVVDLGREYTSPMWQSQSFWWGYTVLGLMAWIKFGAVALALHVYRWNREAREEELNGGQ